MIISLIRHAPTPGNLRSCYVGGTDEELAPEGILLARQSRRDETVRLAHTSALTRAVRTAELLYPNATLIRHPGLNEMDFGRFEGKNKRELENDPAYQVWLDSNCESPCPGGESKQTFTRRCRETFLGILREERERGTEELHFVVHGGTIMAILSGFVEPRRGYFAWKAGFCGGFAIRSAEGGRFTLTGVLPPPEEAREDGTEGMQGSCEAAGGRNEG